MKLSRYVVTVNDHPQKGEHLILNTRTQALVKIEEPLKALLDRVTTLTKDEARPYEAELSDLFKMGIIVRDEADDQERFDRFMEQRKYGIDRSNFTASILTTYSCNFACTYCFEETTRGSGQKLDRPTADLIMEWVKKRALKNDVRQLTINYYGGEPLLNQPMMEHISTHLKAWCEGRGMAFRVNVQTNGLLMTPEFLDKHIPLGLQSARVSVDGTKEVHDRQRPMRGTGQGTFDTVMRNVAHAADRIRISIAAGYDEGDPQGILDLLDYLHEQGILAKLENFMHSPIHPSLGPKHDPGAIASPQCMSNYSTETLLRSTQAIKDSLKQKGVGSKSGLSVSMCPLTTENGGVTIDNNGLIFKCNSMLGHPDLAVGDVREEGYNQKQREFMATENWKHCDADCPYAPICNTGCRLFGFFKHQDFSAKSCEREYMDRFIPQAIKKEYELMRAAKASPMPADARA